MVLNYTSSLAETCFRSSIVKGILSLLYQGFSKGLYFVLQETTDYKIPST